MMILNTEALSPSPSHGLFVVHAKATESVGRGSHEFHKRRHGLAYRSSMSESMIVGLYIMRLSNEDYKIRGIHLC